MCHNLIKPEKQASSDRRTAARQAVYRSRGAQQNLDVTALRAEFIIARSHSFTPASAHLSTAMSHLANISLKTRLRLD